jgi:hypothetical protein
MPASSPLDTQAGLRSARQALAGERGLVPTLDTAAGSGVTLADFGFVVSSAERRSSRAARGDGRMRAIEGTARLPQRALTCAQQDPLGESLEAVAIRYPRASGLNVLP